MTRARAAFCSEALRGGAKRRVVPDACGRAGNLLPRADGASGRVGERGAHVGRTQRSRGQNIAAGTNRCVRGKFQKGM